MSERLSPKREAPADPFSKLAPRPGDIELPAEELTKLLGLFKGIKANLGLKTNPDTLRVRRFQADEPICQRGEPGNSAFYLLPAQDLGVLRDRLAADQARGVEVDPDMLANLERAHAQARERAALTPGCDKLLAEILKLEEAALQAGDVNRARLYARCRLAGTITKLVQSELLKDTEPQLASLLGRLAEMEEKRRVAVARVPSAPLAVRRQQTFWQRLFGSGGAERSRGFTPATIPNDGPADIDYDSGEAPLYDDELFGEMACIDRQPRTATVVATRECFVLEMLRPILDNMRKDAAYREKLDAKYRERVLELHLRALPLFKDLNASLITRIRQDAELLAYEPGTLICDEHEPSDALYLIRSGTVRVMKGASALLSTQVVRDWRQVGQLNPSHSGEHSPARATLWQRLGPEAQAWVLSPAALESPQARQKLLDAMNGLIADPELCRCEGLAEVMQAEQCHLRSWQALAKAGHEFAATLHGLNRALLGVALLGKVSALKLSGDDQLPAPLKAASISDWKAFCTDLEPSSRKPDHPATEAARWLWNRLPSAVQSAVREGKAGAALSDEEKNLIVAAMNDVATNSFALIELEFQPILEADAALQRLVMELRKGGHKWTEYDFRRYSRFRNRLLFHSLYPGFLGAPPSDAGSPLVLAYCTRGDFIGEMGLVLAEPRSATCVAYNHPENDPAREVGPVQLVRIQRELFEHLCQSSRLFADRVEASVRQRQELTRKKQREAEQAAKLRRLPLASDADDLGLTQGQRLMLIDLDRCTRCDECVKACVATHDDGTSRLFLDGPRFQQQVGHAVRSFLAPTTCRSCIDPVCMIPCPVGSIVRGEHGQIEIRDWCIGCEKCAKNCPYGAIQMHPTGILPARSREWRMLPAWKVRADSRGRPWHAHDFQERGWQAVQTPLVLDHHLQKRLGNPTAKIAAGRAVCLRHAFDIEDVGRRIRADTKFRLVITPYVAGTKLWLNGQAVADVESKKGEGLRELELESAAKPSKALKILKPGRNVVAVEVPLKDDLAGPFFELKIVIFEGTVLDLRAVVCDLCQLQPGELTACVKACPHEATRRFDARQGIIVW